MNFMSNKFNILGLILLGVIVLSLVFPYKEGLETANNTQNIENTAELAKQIATPITDMRGTAQYRTHLVGVLVTRTLTTALARAQA